MKRVDVVVTCTDRKSAPVPSHLRLRSVPERPSQLRFGRWTKALTSVDAPLIRAGDLYRGEHWHIARSLPNIGVARGLDVHLWIASAGYGLVTLSTLLKPYAATFTPTHPDSVIAEGSVPSDSAASWWRNQTSWSGPDAARARSIADVAALHPTTTVLIVASPSYLNGLVDDAEAASAMLERPDALRAISAGAPRHHRMASRLLPADARLQPLLGGARQALNVRIARWLLQEAKEKLDLQRAHAALTDLLAAQPPVRRYNRQKMTDDDVRRYVKTALRRSKDVPRSLLLRRLRDSGFGCEQSRFATLYSEVADDLR